MNKTVLVALFALMAAAQIGVPASLAVGREITLAKGEAFRFRAQPVDPYHPFQGRYVALNLTEGRIASDLPLRRGEQVYALIEVDAEGFAVLKALRTEPPKSGAYITTRVRWSNDGTVDLDLPFDRYYMNEDLAPATEQALRERTGDGAAKVWVTVRVRDGDAAAEELYIDGQPIREYLGRQGPR